ncbi:hypothetical protein EAF04_004321 [Stromatinia cepivora]|nr:hypothetical protein EAF04_004321 [Stromatinia cepivora]
MMNLQSWLAAGMRYHRICMALDRGVLFLIPLLSDDIWENPNSSRGAEFDEAISHLKDEGIMKLSNELDADFVVNQILEFALAPFRWDVVDSRTIASDLSIESGIFSISPSTESRIITASSSIGPSTITASSSVGPRISPLKPNLISSILNPPEAAQEPHLPPSVQSDPRGKRRRVDSVSTPDPILHLSPNDFGPSSHGEFLSCSVRKNEMERILGKPLFDGMIESHKHKSAEDFSHDLTTAIHVRYPRHNLKEDFRVKIWVCSSIGKDISQATMGEGDGLRDLLSDTLIKGVEASLCRQRELRQENQGATCAFRIFSSTDDDVSDYEMEIRLDFMYGQHLLFGLSQLPWFPATPGFRSPQFTISF